MALAKSERRIAKGEQRPFYLIRFTKYSTSDKMMLRRIEVISGK
jgi:hypothetical protein